MARPGASIDELLNAERAGDRERMTELVERRREHIEQRRAAADARLRAELLKIAVRTATRP